jgi:hypothetical protein
VPVSAGNSVTAVDVVFPPEHGRDKFGLWLRGGGGCGTLCTCVALGHRDRADRLTANGRHQVLLLEFLAAEAVQCRGRAGAAAVAWHPVFPQGGEQRLEELGRWRP